MSTFPAQLPGAHHSSGASASPSPVAWPRSCSMAGLPASMRCTSVPFSYLNCTFPSFSFERASSSSNSSATATRNVLSAQSLSPTERFRERGTEVCATSSTARFLRNGGNRNGSRVIDSWSERVPQGCRWKGSERGNVLPGAGERRRTWAVRSAEGGGRERADGGADVVLLKNDILRIVCGLDRGVASSGEDNKIVESAAKSLEQAAGERGIDFLTDISRLDGRWRLIYSSGFAAGSLGGQRPGPPTGRFPILIGSVFQRIDVEKKELDNVVSLRVGLLPWPLPSVDLTAILAHSFQVSGRNTIRIFFDRTSVEPSGVLKGLPQITLPELPQFLMAPSEQLRSAEFDTTFLDDDFRISHGDRGELRIFLKA